MTTMPKRIRLSRAKGWRIPPNTVNIARPSKWGNPFRIGEHGTRRECVTKFERLMQGEVAQDAGPPIDEQREVLSFISENIAKLRGKSLACWCPQDGEPCHGDVLIKIANG